MRNTWLNSKVLKPKLGLNTKVVFCLGKATTEQDQKRIEYEHELYKDIVQSDFEDNYLHNTYKAMSFLL